MMRTVRKKTEWFPTTGDRVLGSIPRSDYFPGQPWATADLRPRAGCLRRRMVLDGLDESSLRMTGAAYVKHHFDGRGNISHSVCIRKEQLKAPDAEGRVFKFSSGNLIGFFTLFNGLAWKAFFREARLRREGFFGNGVPWSLSRSLVFRRVETSESATSFLKIVIDQSSIQFQSAVRVRHYVHFSKGDERGFPPQQEENEVAQHLA
ncbi:hypothetical protein ACFE04_011447 [Oxalis oulophora]